MATIYDISAKSEQFILLDKKPFYWMVIVPVSAGLLKNDYIVYREVNSSNIYTGQQIGGIIEQISTNDFTVNNNDSNYAYTKFLPMNENVLSLNALGLPTLAEALRGWNQVSLNSNLINQQQFFSPIYIDTPIVCTGVRWYQVTQGNYTANNYNGIGLYSLSSGTLTLVASTTNDGNIWKQASTSWGSKDFSSTVKLTPGLYFLSPLYNRSAVVTDPILAFAGTGYPANFYRFGLSGTTTMVGVLAGRTTLASSQAISGLTVNIYSPYFNLY